MRESIGRRLWLTSGVLALLPLAVAVAGWRGGAGTGLLALGGLGALLAIVLPAVLVNGPLLRRLRDLTTAVGRIRSGELDRAVAAQGADELAELAGALEALRRNTLALAEAERELAAGRRTLRRLGDGFERFVEAADRDLKPPLRAIDGLAGILYEDLEDALPAESRRHLELLQSRVVRLASLFEVLLDYARAGIRRAPCEVVDLCELVDAAINRACPAGLQVLVNGAGGRVSTRREPLLRILGDLLELACRRNDEARGPVALDMALEDRELQVVVTDCGPGMPPPIQDRLFVPFASSEVAGATAGTGSSLAVASKLLDACGGALDVRSDPARGHGAAFAIRWPIDAVLSPLLRPNDRPDPLAAIAAAPRPTAAAAAVGGDSSANYTPAPR